MTEYHKIHTVFKRDPDTKFKTLLEGGYSIPELEYLAHNRWVFTEKVDGTNIRVLLDADGNIEFRGKTDRTELPAPLAARLEALFRPQQQLLHEQFPEGVCLYGEGYGARIQKGGGKYRSDQDFVLFDVNIGGWWLQRRDVINVAMVLNLDFVPEIGCGTLPDMVAMAREGFKSQWGDFLAEGIVARPATELQARSGHRIITKIKHRDFRK